MFSKAQELELLQDEPQAGNASELRVVKSLLWDAIAASLNASERDEVRRVIGVSRLDENEALFAEASALADILGEVQLNTKELLARHSLCRNVQRSMVESEVRMLMERLRSLAAAAPFTGSAIRARDPESVVPKAQAKDKSIFDYLAASSNLSLDGIRSPLARPTTASSLSRPTTSSSLSRPSTACSGGSNSQAYDASVIVSSMQDKLNVYEIDAVKDALRAAIEEEKMYLMEDIDYLTALLTDEADMRAQAAVPPPPLSDLKEYCLKLQSAVADEEARHEHELRVSQMFAAAAADSSKAARLRGMINASRRAQPQPHQFAGGLMNGGGNAAAPALNACAIGGVDQSSGEGSSKPWSGAGEGVHSGQGRPHPQADVFVLEGAGGAAARGGGAGAAKRLANARGAVERTIPLLPPQPPPPLSQAGSAGADAKSTDKNKSGVPLGSAAPSHSAVLLPPSQEAMQNGRAVIPQSHRRGHRSLAQADSGSPEHPGTGLAGNVGTGSPVTLVGEARHGEGGALPGAKNAHSSTSLEQGAVIKSQVALEQQDTSPLQGSSPGGQGTHCAALLHASQSHGSSLPANHQHTHSPQGHCPPSMPQGQGSSAACERRSPGGRVRPSSAARLRALVANPPALPDASRSSRSSSQGHATQGHSAVGNGTGSILCGAHGHGGLQAELGSVQGWASGTASLASEAVEQQGSLEHNSRSCVGDVACAGNQGSDLDTKVDSLKGGVAAILLKHGLSPELTKSQTWRPQSAASSK